MSLSNTTEGVEAFRGLNSEDQSSVIAILTAFALSIVLLSVPIRVYVRGNIISYGFDDVSYFLATVLAIGQSSAVFYAISNGLGKSDELLDTTREIARFEAIYSADILYIIILAFSKFATGFLFLCLTPRRRHHVATWSTMGLSTIWIVTSVLLLAIRCNNSSPWLDISSAKCSSMLTRWQVITAFDIIIEILLFGISIFIVWDLQMSLINKILVVWAFAARLPTIILSALHLHYLVPLFTNPPPTSNFFLLLAPAISLAQLQIGYSILASIVPYLKNLMAAFDQNTPSTINTAELSSRQKKTGGSQRLTTNSKVSSQGTHAETEWPQRLQLPTTTKSTSPSSPTTTWPRVHTKDSISSYNPEPTLYEALVMTERGDLWSENAQTGVIEDDSSHKMIIKKGVEWSVDYDRRSGKVFLTDLSSSSGSPPVSPTRPEVRPHTAV